MKKECFKGRLFTQDQVPEGLVCQSLPAFYERDGQFFCSRCASPIEEDWVLPLGPSYCRACMMLGRVRSDQVLYYSPPQEQEPGSYLVWQGQLTEGQSRVSVGLLEAWRIKQETLVHAVTGAGKTEMIYPLLDQALREGASVCLASPRMDVCRELAARLKRDFTCPIDLLHAGSHPYSGAPLVLATTHQLLKFYQAFDLLIIDEVDAFPYVDNSMLYRAVEASVKKGGLRIYLTATSTDQLDLRIAAGSLKRLRLPRRFHAQPLVEPAFSFLAHLGDKVARHRLPRKLVKDIKRQRETGFPLLIFLPQIEAGQAFSQVLSTFFPEEKIGFVSSKSPDRKEQVQAFRDGDLSILISTTILERGVTFPKVDVFVLEAHHRLFSKSSLIQIGGRVGRSLERPTGILTFYHEGVTEEMIGARREIQELNREAGFKEE